MDLNVFGGSRLKWVRVASSGPDVDGSEWIWRESSEADVGRYDGTGCGEILMHTE